MAFLHKLFFVGTGSRNISKSRIRIRPKKMSIFTTPDQKHGKIAAKNFTDFKFCKEITLMLLGQIVTCLSRQICNNQLQKKVQQEEKSVAKIGGIYKISGFFFFHYLWGVEQHFYILSIQYCTCEPCCPSAYSLSELSLVWAKDPAGIEPSTIPCPCLPTA